MLTSAADGAEGWSNFARAKDSVFGCYAREWAQSLDGTAAKLCVSARFLQFPTPIEKLPRIAYLERGYGHLSLASALCSLKRLVWKLYS